MEKYIHPGDIKGLKESQINLDFNQDASKLFLEEREKVAKEYRILNLDGLTKRNGKWFLSNVPVEILDEIEERNSDMYRPHK